MDLLQPAPEGQELQLKDGRKIKSAKELAKHLETLSESAFRHHNENNDFSDWIDSVFKDSLLARQIREVRTKKEMAQQIKARLANLKGGVPFNTERV